MSEQKDNISEREKDKNSFMSISIKARFQSGDLWSLNGHQTLNNQQRKTVKHYTFFFLFLEQTKIYQTLTGGMKYSHDKGMTTIFFFYLN